jgi:hypothetical protein
LVSSAKRRTKVRKYTTAVVVVLALAASGGIALGADTGRSHPGTTTIRTLQLTTAATPVDVDGDGKASVGDQVIFQTVHENPKTHARVGYGDAVCTQISTGTRPVYDCAGSDHLRGGEIREAGSGSSTTDARWAILGGTRAYRNASGEYRAHFLDANLTRARVTFTISHVSG